MKDQRPPRHAPDDFPVFCDPGTERTMQRMMDRMVEWSPLPYLPQFIDPSFGDLRLGTMEVLLQDATEHAGRPALELGLRQLPRHISRVCVSLAPSSDEIREVWVLAPVLAVAAEPKTWDERRDYWRVGDLCHVEGKGGETFTIAELSEDSALLRNAEGIIIQGRESFPKMIRFTCGAPSSCSAHGADAWLDLHFASSSVVEIDIMLKKPAGEGGNRIGGVRPHSTAHLRVRADWSHLPYQCP